MRVLILIGVGVLLGVLLGGCAMHFGRRWLKARDARAREAGLRAALSEMPIAMLQDELSRRGLYRSN